MSVRNRTVRIVQGELKLEAKLLERTAHPLKAPEMGNMVRIIHESAACLAFYRLRKGNCTIFEFKTDRASFEYEYPL